MSDVNDWVVVRANSRNVARRARARETSARAVDMNDGREPSRVEQLAEPSRVEQLAEPRERRRERARAIAAALAKAHEDVMKSHAIALAIARVVREVKARRRGRGVTLATLGSGSPGASAAARAQLGFAKALALRMKEEFVDVIVRIRVVEPCLTIVDEEAIALAFAGTEATTEASASDGASESASDGREDIVVYYMPHCEGDLYEAVLRARWSASGLKDFVCIGNTFATYVDRWAARTVDPEKKRPSRVIAAAAIAESTLVDPGDKFTVQGAFNDTSVMTFSGTDVFEALDVDFEALRVDAKREE